MRLQAVHFMKMYVKIYLVQLCTAQHLSQGGGLHVMLGSIVGERLRWVRHPYPSVCLPIMHVLVVTNLCSCVEIFKIAALPLSCTMYG